MIIFNLWALLVVPLVYLCCLPFYSYFPELMKGPHEMLVLGSITAVVGGVTDYFGIKARLFFLPVWLIGLGIVCYQIGTVGMILFGVIAAVAIFFAVKSMRKESAENWKRAQEELAKTPQPGRDWDALRFWQWVQDTLYMPLFSQTPEMRQHNLKVLDGIILIKPELSEAEALKFGLFKKALEESKGEPKSKMIDANLEKGLKELIEKKLVVLKKKGAKSGPAAVPPKIPVSQPLSK